MLIFFLLSVLVAGGLCYGAFVFLQYRILEETLKFDDAKGYYLISCIVVGFVVCSGSFYVGQVLGFDVQDATSSMLALVLLMDIMAALLMLIYGLVKLRQPEHY